MKKQPLKKQLQKVANSLWKKAGFLIHGNRCEYCGERATHPHHYIPKSRCGIMRYDINNFVPLCAKCHYKIHFSPNPDEVRAICEMIHTYRGDEWYSYIQEKKMDKSASFNKISWIQSQIDNLQYVIERGKNER